MNKLLNNLLGMYKQAKMNKKAEEDLIEVGWGLNTNDESEIKDNAEWGDSDNPRETDKTFWDKINKDIERVENYFLREGYKNFFTKVRDEGHGSDNALGGTAWMTKQQLKDFIEKAEDWGGEFVLSESSGADLKIIVDYDEALMFYLYINVDYKDLDEIGIESTRVSKNKKQSSKSKAVKKQAKYEETVQGDEKIKDSAKTFGYDIKFAGHYGRWIYYYLIDNKGNIIRDDKEYQKVYDEMKKRIDDDIEIKDYGTANLIETIDGELVRMPTIAISEYTLSSNHKDRKENTGLEEFKREFNLSSSTKKQATIVEKYKNDFSGYTDTYQLETIEKNLNQYDIDDIKSELSEAKRFVSKMDKLKRMPHKDVGNYYYMKDKALIAEKLIEEKTKNKMGKSATIKHENGVYNVYSESGKCLGKGYKTKEEAEKRLKQVEYFKHKNASTLKVAKANLNGIIKVMDKMWHGNEDKNYITIGKWGIGLGGYDTGYVISYDGNELFAITPDNVYDAWEDDEFVKELTGYTQNEIFQFIKDNYKHADLPNLDFNGSKIDIETKKKSSKRTSLKQVEYFKNKKANKEDTYEEWGVLCNDLDEEWFDSETGAKIFFNKVKNKVDQVVHKVYDISNEEPEEIQVDVLYDKDRKINKLTMRTSLKQVVISKMAKSLKDIPDSVKKNILSDLVYVILTGKGSFAYKTVAKKLETIIKELGYGDKLKANEDGSLPTMEIVELISKEPKVMDIVGKFANITRAF